MSSCLPHGLPHVDAMTPAVLVITGPVTRGEVTGWCDALRELLGPAGGRLVECDVAGIGPPGLAAVDLLARMQLTARRSGGRIRLRDPAPELRALLDLVGLRFDVVGQPEQREPPLDVQEAVETGDPAL
ncbi:STAS domain-containing protein [Streptomyces sp. SAI-170]|uniref:STAS domain-containing protein n=1 Tax=Streptomyces sp. SAI-170 TaxID=3377729 RepID=UPI003C7A63BA